MSMLKYTIRRLLALVPILFGVLFLSFSLSRAMPGNPYLIKMGEHITNSQWEIYLKEVERLKLDEPVFEQFIAYFKNCLGPFFAYLVFAYMGGLVIYSGVNTVKEIKKKASAYA